MTVVGGRAEGMRSLLEVGRTGGRWSAESRVFDRAQRCVPYDGELHRGNCSGGPPRRGLKASSSGPC